MNYCTRCGKPTNNGIMCEDCLILGSPWLSAMKRKENDLEEELAELKSENAELRARLEKAAEEDGVITIIEPTTYTSFCGFVVRRCTLREYKELYCTPEIAEARLKEIEEKNKNNEK